MHKLFFILINIVSFTAHSKTIIYKGQATNKAGQVVYLENHTTDFNSKNEVQKATTQYTRPSGEVMGVLKSDFSRSITAPNYTFEDLRDGSSHGMEYDGETYTLWKKEKNKEREQKKIKASYFDKEALVVGCQGLHYYLINNLENLRERKNIKVKYMIPGKLDYFSFLMNVEREDEKTIYFKVKIQSLFLRAFVSSLNMAYDKKERRLISYDGLSNISTDDGDLQNVKISYSFNQ